MDGAELIAVERRRQIEAEGFDAKHDAGEDQAEGQLVAAAMCYATAWPMKLRIPVLIHGNENCGCREADCPHRFIFPHTEKKWVEDPWPWHPKWDKREKHDRIRRLTIAGALIAAEIDRIQRLEDRTEAGGK